MRSAPHTCAKPIAQGALPHPHAHAGILQVLQLRAHVVGEAEGDSKVVIKSKHRHVLAPCKACSPACSNTERSFLINAMGNMVCRTSQYGLRCDHI